MASSRLPSAAFLPVGPESIALLRLGEACNLRCPMCTNSGQPERWRLEEAQLWRRLDRLAGLGFRGLALTGGEPTLHPSFDALVSRIGHLGWRWFLHTNATQLSAVRVQRCRQAGLERALVSLHGPRAAHVVLSGADTWAATLAGTDALLAAGVPVVLNCVLARPNLDGLAAHIAWVADRFPGAGIKLVGAARTGRGTDWASAHVSLAELRQPLIDALDAADLAGIDLQLEGIPRCAHRRWSRANHGRSGWGETHYLADDDGHRVLSMAWLDRRSRWYPRVCRGCTARRGCPGLPLGAPEDPGLVPRRSLR